MVTITKEHVHFTFSGSHKPVQTVPSGSTVRFETYDCFYNQLLPEGADITKIDSSKANAATGPLCVEEALPGDTLKIEILDITTGPVGVCGTFPGSSWDKRGTLLEEEQFRRLTVKDGMAEFDSAVQIPVRPMIGVIGTAPKEGAVSTITPMDHGGNMDCTQIKAGTTLYLPVYVPGALLSMGDLHAVMGDGEVCGCGLEIEGNGNGARYRPERCSIPMARCHSGRSSYHYWGHAETVESAWKLATARMEAFISSKTGLSHEDTSILLSLCGDLAVCQTVNPMKTVRMGNLPLNIF